MKTIFITGAAKGLGASTTSIFLKKGYRVIAADVLFEVVVDLRPQMELIRLPLDVSSSTSVEAAADTVKDLGISIDILLNNAGIFNLSPLSEMETKDLEKIISVNTFGPGRLIKAFLPDLIRNRGRVIQISSESVKFPGLFQPYQISKIAMEAYSRSVRQELLLKGVTMSIIRPGAIRTDLFHNLDTYTNPVSNSHFVDEFDQFVRNTTRFVGKIVAPEHVGSRIFKVATCQRPKYVYSINNNPVLTVLSWLPDRIIDLLVLKLVRRRRK